MYFLDIIFNFSKNFCVLPSTLCMTEELWPRRLIWHQDIRVTHCQSRAMSFIFTQYSFCNSFIHGLISPSCLLWWWWVGVVIFRWTIRDYNKKVVNLLLFRIILTGMSDIQKLAWFWTKIVWYYAWITTLPNFPPRRRPSIASSGAAQPDSSGRGPPLPPAHP